MESRKLDSAGMAAQTEINLAEAKSGSMFKGGWRPATGWICVGGMGYEFLFRPLFGWVAQLVGFAAGTDLAALPMPPEIAMDQLLALLTALLGLAGYRTYERRTGGIPGGQ